MLHWKLREPPAGRVSSAWMLDALPWKAHSNQAIQHPRLFLWHKVKVDVTINSVELFILTTMLINIRYYYK